MTVSPRRKTYFMPTTKERSELKDPPFVRYDVEPAMFRRKLLFEEYAKINAKQTDKDDHIAQFAGTLDAQYTMLAVGITDMGGDWTEYAGYFGDPAPQWPFGLDDTDLEYKKKIVSYFAGPETLDLTKLINPTFFPTEEELGKSDEPQG